MSQAPPPPAGLRCTKRFLSKSTKIARTVAAAGESAILSQAPPCRKAFSKMFATLNRLLSLHRETHYWRFQNQQQGSPPFWEPGSPLLEALSKRLCNASQTVVSALRVRLKVCIVSQTAESATRIRLLSLQGEPDCWCLRPQFPLEVPASPPFGQFTVSGGLKHLGVISKPETAIR